MIATLIKIWIDEENQIIRQIVKGDVDEQDARKITEETGKQIEGLKNAGTVGILLYADTLGKPNAAARKILLANLKRKNLRGFAVVGKRAMQRAMVNLMALAARTKKLKMFATEREALDFLRR